MNSRIDPEHIAILAALLVGWSILTIVRYLIIPAAATLAGMRRPRQGGIVATAAADSFEGPPVYVQQYGRLDRSATGGLAVIDYRPDTKALTSTKELLPRPVRRPPDGNA
jgi:hypothetical protein